MSQKYCGSCDKIKEHSEFSKNSSRPDGLQSHCKDCRNKKLKEWYSVPENKQKHKAKVKINRKESTQKIKKLMLEFMIDKQCIDCGISDIEVLEFDHKDPAQKEESISNMVSKGASWNKIEKEIAKCDIRCANCHRKKTVRQFGYYKLGLPA